MPKADKVSQEVINERYKPYVLTVETCELLPDNNDDDDDKTILDEEEYAPTPLGTKMSVADGRWHMIVLHLCCRFAI